MMKFSARCVHLKAPHPEWWVKNDPSYWAASELHRNVVPRLWRLRAVSPYGTKMAVAGSGWPSSVPSCLIKMHQLMPTLDFKSRKHLDRQCQPCYLANTKIVKPCVNATFVSHTVWQCGSTVALLQEGSGFESQDLLEVCMFSLCIRRFSLRIRRFSLCTLASSGSPETWQLG